MFVDASTFCAVLNKEPERDIFLEILLVAPEIVTIGKAEQRLALDAYARFGKGQHPAKLNMGDCFAYACARANGLPLLFKGNDFGQTDIEAVDWTDPI